MSVRVRGSFYRALKNISYANYITVGDLVRQLVTHDFKLNKIDSGVFNRAYKSVIEIREVGVILNNYTKQVNANIKSRKQIDPTFVDAFENIVQQAINDFMIWRESNYLELFRDLKIKREGGFEKINKQKLVPKQWHFMKLSYSPDDAFYINSKSKKLGFSQNKFINSIIRLFLNQGNFFDKETKELQGFFIKSLSLIKVNAFQIYRNKKNNSYKSEIEIAEKIINFTNNILGQLKDDPVLYAGRKFDVTRFNLTVNKLNDCLI